MTTKHSSSSLDNSAISRRKRKHQKVTRACDSCKSRKRRCNGEVPCTTCQANGADCTYLASYTRGRLVQPKPAALAEHDMSVGTSTVSSIQYAVDPPSCIDGHKPSRVNSPEASTNYAGQFLGPTSPYTFLRRAWKRFENGGSNANFSGGAMEEPKHSEPIFMFGDCQSQSVDIETFELPSRNATMQLLDQYFDLGMPTYRFLHKPSVTQWLDTYHQINELEPDPVLLPPARCAVVFAVLATARLLNIDDNNEWLSPTEDSYMEGEKLFRIAQGHLERESGRVRLESVQARLAEVLYLLHTSRPNQAWYKFGTAAQLALALGLHRSTTGGSGTQDLIARECGKRVFWATSTIDTYLSIILGRPALIHLHDVDQDFPDPVEDEDLTAESMALSPHGRDSIMTASVLHEQITRIVKKVAQEQYSVLRKSNEHKLETAAKLNAEIAAWHNTLPAVLSGVVHPSSLIPIFRRQTSVLQLAHAHALMLINRPSLLMDTSHNSLKESQVESCLSAAKSTLKTVLAAGMGQALFKAFWHTQFISFNALSIVYVWQILRKQGRLPAVPSVSELELARLAESVQRHLDDASEANAPSLRYSIVLQELQQEVCRLSKTIERRSSHMSRLLEAPTSSTVAANSTNFIDANLSLHMPDTSDTFHESGSNDFLLDPNLWHSLDSFAFLNFDQFE